LRPADDVGMPGRIGKSYPRAQPAPQSPAAVRPRGLLALLKWVLNWGLSPFTR
jgi:hypothetical protein